MKYRSYIDELDEEDLKYKERTAADVRRPACPLCQSKTYVTPLMIGLINSVDILDLETVNEPGARATYTCVAEGFDWNCDECSIYFSI